jgi:hypothetical protein
VLAAQVIIEKAYQGNKDHIRGALDLFVDFMAVFVRSNSLRNISVKSRTTFHTVSQYGRCHCHSHRVES